MVEEATVSHLIVVKSKAWNANKTQIISLREQDIGQLAKILYNMV